MQQKRSACRLFSGNPDQQISSDRSAGAPQAGAAERVAGSQDAVVAADKEVWPQPRVSLSSRTTCSCP